MTLFKEAENEQAYLKLGILGFAKSGKTYTAAHVARAIHKYIDSTKPVYMIDTEIGSDYLIHKFKEWEIKFCRMKTRSFVDLLDGVTEGEKQASILIIDSVTHFWENVQSSYRKAHKKRFLSYYDWGPIKEEWRKFTDAFVNSKLHIIICGRAQEVLEEEIDEQGKKQLHSVGVKMRTEKELGYEPSFLFEMKREQIPQENKRARRYFKHDCFVFGSRLDYFHGLKFEWHPEKVMKNPDIIAGDIKPILDFLNIGGKHIGVENGTNSEVLFQVNNEYKQQHDIALEKIENLLVRLCPKKQDRLIILNQVFLTDSWNEIKVLSNDVLKEGYKTMEEKLIPKEVIL